MRLLAAWCALFTALIVVSVAQAQTYPSRPITLVVAFPAGAAEIRVLAARAETDPAALAQLRNVTVVDGRQVDFASLLHASLSGSVRKKLRMFFLRESISLYRMETGILRSSRMAHIRIPEIPPV